MYTNTHTCSCTLNTCLYSEFGGGDAKLSEAAAAYSPRFNDRPDVLVINNMRGSPIETDDQDNDGEGTPNSDSAGVRRDRRRKRGSVGGWFKRVF